MLQAKLNLIDPQLFPLHEGPVAEADSELPPTCVVGSNMLRYHLRPLAKKGLDTGEAVTARGGVCDSSTFGASTSLICSMVRVWSDRPLPRLHPTLLSSRLPRCGGRGGGAG